MNRVYDSAYYEDLAGRLYGLVITFSDRLPSDHAQWLHHVIDVGEYGLALEDLVAMIPYDKITTTGQEQGDIVALARQMQIDLGSNWRSAAEEPCRSMVRIYAHELTISTIVKPQFGFLHLSRMASVATELIFDSEARDKYLSRGFTIPQNQIYTRCRFCLRVARR